MENHIAIDFDFRSDTPGYPKADPDARSPTLRRYHRLLWSKPLPNGVVFELLDTSPGIYLHHRSQLGEFSLASDAVIPTFRKEARLAPILQRIPEELAAFMRVGYTIGGMMLFPGSRIGRQMTINGARGFHPRIKDRFDLTVECIRRHSSTRRVRWVRYSSGIQPSLASSVALVDTCSSSSSRTSSQRTALPYVSSCRSTTSPPRLFPKAWMLTEHINRLPLGLSKLGTDGYFELANHPSVVRPMLTYVVVPVHAANAALVILQGALAPIAKAATLVLKSHGYQATTIALAIIGPDVAPDN